ncbi:MAG: hypothetical protein AABW79_00870 [Nanoarchaeota archaeon]
MFPRDNPSLSELKALVDIVCREGYDAENPDRTILERVFTRWYESHEYGSNSLID